MPIDCPVCKADNAHGPLCRRCKADLALLFQLDAQRQHSLAEARQCMHDGRWQEAVRLAGRADGLRTDVESRGLVAVTAVLTRAYDLALRYYRSIDDVSTLGLGKTK